MKKRREAHPFTLAALLAAALVLRSPLPPAAAEEGVPVVVSILPLKYFAERIAGERATVSVMVGPGRNPATYEPTPKQMTRLSDAAVYFSIGVPFERVWLDRIAEANPGMKIVDTAAGVARRIEDGHEHGGRDPHVWTNPLLAVHIARAMAEAFIAADPGHRAEYESNLNRLSADLTLLDQEIREILGTVTKRKFMVFHPSWGYFADAYGLEQIAVERGGSEPGARHLAEVIETAKREGLDVIFFQEQFSPRTAEAVADAIGGKVVAVNPLSGDYIANLRAVAILFAEALQ